MIWYLSELLQESVDKSTETWDEILALDHFGPYRRAALTFAGQKEQDYMVRYDTHYEDAKKALGAALAPLG